MGEGWEGVEASGRDSESGGLSTREAHHVSIGPEEDRGGTAGEVGEGEGGKKK